MKKVTTLVLLISGLLFVYIMFNIFSNKKTAPQNMNQGTPEGTTSEKALEKDYSYEELLEREDLSVATFAGGCFWCMEGPFEQEEAVVEVISGYAGGQIENPSYDQVASGKTKHREAIQVYYFADEITYERLLEIYWYQIDPTDAEGQFADKGFQYTTAIFYHNEEQKEAAEKSKQMLQESGRHEGDIVTEILPFVSFYPAEDYHQDFYKKSSTRYKQYETLSGRKGYKERLVDLYENLFN